MTTIPLDEKSLNSLTGPQQLLAVSDASGKVVGFFAPIGLEHAPDYAAAAGHFYPRKDMPRPDGPKYTTEEVINHLKSLENP